MCVTSYSSSSPKHQKCSFHQRTVESLKESLSHRLQSRCFVKFKQAVRPRKNSRKQVLLLLPCSQKGRGGLHGEASSGPAAVQPRAVHDARAGQQLTLKMILILRVCSSLTTYTFGFMCLFKLKLNA